VKANPPSVDEDFYIEIKYPVSGSVDQVQDAADIEFLRQNLYRALKILSELLNGPENSRGPC
jgi:hypothetical protein